MTDTVKRASPGLPVVAETLDRRTLWLAQTPQGFRRDLLLRAYQAAGADASSATDECGLVERLGAQVALVPGEPANFKITPPEDVARARALTEAPFATGVAYDCHRFEAGRRLVLGGVEFEGDGLLGHSDADVCAHAIGDAILGAASPGAAKKASSAGGGAGGGVGRLTRPSAPAAPPRGRRCPRRGRRTPSPRRWWP